MNIEKIYNHREQLRLRMLTINAARKNKTYEEIYGDDKVRHLKQLRAMQHVKEI